jgi:hypothetical protein
MTERAGAALSHVLIRAGRMTFFGCEFFGPDRIRLTLRGNRRRQFVPAPDAWLHEPYAGNAGLAEFIPPPALLGEISSS